MGNSPPARKVAVSPEMVVRFGDARVVTSPTRSDTSRAVAISTPNSRPAAWTVLRPGTVLKLNFVPPVTNWPVAGSNGSEIEPAGRPNNCEASRFGKFGVVRSVIDPKLRPRATPNRKPPVLSRVRILPLISLASERLTSAKRTFRLTCIGVAVFRRLTTRVPSPTKAWTRFSASSASSGLAMVPVNSTKLLVVLTAIFASGIARLNI